MDISITEEILRENYNIAQSKTNPVSREEADDNLLEIYNIIKANRKNFIMSAWHSLIIKNKKERTCGTAHCLAGWADALHNQYHFKLLTESNLKYLKEIDEEDLNDEIEEFHDDTSGVYEDDIVMFYEMCGDDVENQGWKYIWQVGHLFFHTEKGAEEEIIGAIEEYLKHIGKI